MEPSDGDIAVIGCGVYLVAFVISFLIFGLVGWAVGKGKGMGGLGFVLGGFLGLIGILIIALIPGSSGSRVRPRRRIRRGATGRTRLRRG